MGSPSVLHRRATFATLPFCRVENVQVFFGECEHASAFANAPGDEPTYLAGTHLQLVCGSANEPVRNFIVFVAVPLQSANHNGTFLAGVPKIIGHTRA